MIDYLEKEIKQRYADSQGIEQDSFSKEKLFCVKTFENLYFFCNKYYNILVSCFINRIEKFHVIQAIQYI